MINNEIEIIRKVVGKYLKYNFSNEKNNKLRIRAYVEARMIYFLIAREITKLPLSILGDSIKPHKNHATVLHSCTTMKNYIETDARMRFLYKDILNLVMKELEGSNNVELTHEEQKIKIYNLEYEKELLLKDNLKLVKTLQDFKSSLKAHKTYLKEGGYNFSYSKTFKILETNNI